MKSFQEFAHEAFLETTKQSASLILELCGSSNSLSTAISNLLDNYRLYLESVKKSIQLSLTTYDQEISELQARKDAFNALPPEEQGKTVQEELRSSKDMLENCIGSTNETIKIATCLIESAKASNRTGLEKEAENLIVKVAEMEVRSGSNLVKYYEEQNKNIITTTTDDKVLKAISDRKIQYLQYDYDRLLSQKQKAEQDLIAITETIEKLSP